MPFLRNHFFEQEFFDVSQVEVLRGPQGTLYGRNATAGVVNLVSAKPTDQFEAMGSIDVGNYSNRRLEGMLNIPIIGDKLDFRVAGEWTKRDGYSFNEETDHSTDGRDLWSGRASLLIHPLDKLAANFIWEHFQEDDDRLRSGKQLCARDTAPSVVNGAEGPQYPNYGSFLDPGGNLGKEWLSQGCHAASLYSPESFDTPDASSFPFIIALEAVLSPNYMARGTNPYAGVTQSRDLRTISSLIDPKYRAKNDTFEFNADYVVAPELTLSSQTGYGTDSLYSTEDLNRYNTQGGIFLDPGGNTWVAGIGVRAIHAIQAPAAPTVTGGCRTISEEQRSRKQFYQEVRLASSFRGDFNFHASARNYHAAIHTAGKITMIHRRFTLDLAVSPKASSCEQPTSEGAPYSACPNRAATACQSACNSATPGDTTTLLC